MSAERCVEVTCASRTTVEHASQDVQNRSVLRASPSPWSTCTPSPSCRLRTAAPVQAQARRVGPRKSAQRAPVRAQRRTHLPRTFARGERARLSACVKCARDCPTRVRRTAGRVQRRVPTSPMMTHHCDSLMPPHRSLTRGQREPRTNSGAGECPWRSPGAARAAGPVPGGLLVNVVNCRSRGRPLTAVRRL